MKNDKDVIQLGQEIITRRYWSGLESSSRRRYLNSVYDSIHDMIRIKNVMNISEIAKITELSLTFLNIFFFRTRIMIINGFLNRCTNRSSKLF